MFDLMYVEQRSRMSVEMSWMVGRLGNGLLSADHGGKYLIYGTAKNSNPSPTKQTFFMPSLKKTVIIL